MKKGGTDGAEIRKLQKDGFYRVDLGETKIPEGLITGDISAMIDTPRHSPTWTIIHAGGARGWVPWNYKLFLHEEQTKYQPSRENFHDLCSILRDSYGKCLIMTNAQSWKAADYSDFNASSAFQHQPSSPLKLLSMVCCPNVAQDYGHELLHLPARCAYLSPLASAWWTVKWFISNNRVRYSEEVHNKDTVHKYIFCIDLIDDSLKSMTKKKWKDAVSRVRKTEDHYLKEHL
ncbi:uncharacterized protein C21orf140 homolog [Conger conger]|uniref:uncharacterized protein C21orf140 homolog n=1 Tax=Conger conger TaxID=82655 RepID=UPI002A5A1FDD|nr:uncharacterized protein C21orf140 homolog [Conger conger]